MWNLVFPIPSVLLVIVTCVQALPVPDGDQPVNNTERYVENGDGWQRVTNVESGPGFKRATFITSFAVPGNPGDNINAEALKLPANLLDVFKNVDFSRATFNLTTYIGDKNAADGSPFPFKIDNSGTNNVFKIPNTVFQNGVPTSGIIKTFNISLNNISETFNSQSIPLDQTQKDFIAKTLQNILTQTVATTPRPNVLLEGYSGTPVGISQSNWHNQQFPPQLQSFEPSQPQPAAQPTSSTDSFGANDFRKYDFEYNRIPSDEITDNNQPGKRNSGSVSIDKPRYK